MTKRTIAKEFRRKNITPAKFYCLQCHALNTIDKSVHPRENNVN